MLKHVRRGPPFRLDDEQTRDARFWNSRQKLDRWCSRALVLAPVQSTRVERAVHPDFPIRTGARQTKALERTMCAGGRDGATVTDGTETPRETGAVTGPDPIADAGPY